MGIEVEGKRMRGMARRRWLDNAIERLRDKGLLEEEVYN